LSEPGRRRLFHDLDRLLEPARDFDRSNGTIIGGYPMKHALMGTLLAGAACAFGLATPAVAQVAGNPGDLHSPTVYTSQYRADAYGYTPGYEGPLGPVGVLAAPVTAPLAMLTGGFPGGGGCGVTQDFNGRYTAVCGL